MVLLLSAVGNHIGWTEDFAGFLFSRLVTRCVTSVPAPAITPTLTVREERPLPTLTVRGDEEVFRCGSLKFCTAFARLDIIQEKMGYFSTKDMQTPP